MQHENLANIRLRISSICNHILSKHNELRYQIKIHEIAERLKKDNLQPSPPPQILFLLQKQIMLLEEKTKEHTKC
jgi:hypothetical protein